jgi:diguanylate cyclase (GGDEF)-like protein
MKIQGTFLSSRAGRRIFWSLLLAAALPIASFGVAMYAMLSTHFESQTARQQQQLTKFAGMGLLDRLLAARTALDIVSRSRRVDADAPVGHRRGRVLLEVAQIDAQGNAIVGSASLARRWRDNERDRDGATLLLGAGGQVPGVRPVLIVVPDDARRTSLWIAEIDPAFLFSELSADAGGSRICVFDATLRPVHCPEWNAAEEATLRRDVQPGVDTRAKWKLFLRSDFSIDDWTLVSMDAPSERAPEVAPLARLTALAAVATLLFVGMLGLIQVRRTMVPLERLIAGTRRLSERDYAARVRVGHDDEFGELARSFNHMAERIGHQVQALHVQSAIDHEILNGLNVARVLQRVAHRLEQLVPSAATCVIEFDRSSRALARVHTAAAAISIISMPRTDALCMAQLPDNDNVLCEDPPPWLLGLLQSPSSRVWVRCAKVDDELLGMLVIATEDRAIEDVDTRREIAELGDRVSVTLSSADRERRLVERATHDSLTGLANRAGLHEFIDARLADDLRAPFTVLFVDLDRFKEVNDSMGHQIGDELLRTIGKRLQQRVPANAFVARPGGDEFVLVVRGPPASADELAHALCSELAQPIELGGRTVAVGASIGLAKHPEHGLTSSDLMRRADMAMYSAKSRGGGTAAWFEPALDARIAERTALLADLRHAQMRGQFEVHYQPRVDTRSGAIVCAEALLRWRHPERGFVPVPTFINLLEETGLINTVGLWVIERAVSQLARWQAQGLALESIAVNLSTRQLQVPNLPEQVAAILARCRLEPAHLELEVTESIFMGDASQAIRVLRQLHDSGIRIALDDFGTGYSSLSYLHKLPIGLLKVDRSFVSELGQRDSALALTRSIVALARALKLRVVAEGVETQQQLGLLTELGCDELQGFLFAPALEPTAFATLVAQPQSMIAAATA